MKIFAMKLKSANVSHTISVNRLAFLLCPKGANPVSVLLRKKKTMMGMLETIKIAETKKTVLTTLACLVVTRDFTSAARLDGPETEVVIVELFRNLEARARLTDRIMRHMVTIIKQVEKIELDNAAFKEELIPSK